MGLAHVKLTKKESFDQIIKLLSNLTASERRKLATELSAYPLLDANDVYRMRHNGWKFSDESVKAIETESGTYMLRVIK